MEILYKDKNIIAINKPAAVPSQSDPSGDPDAMSLTSEQLRANGENADLWLVHRLDRVVGGVLVFARNKKYAALLSALFSGNCASKGYLAVIDGVGEGGKLVDFLAKDAKKGMAVVVDEKNSGAKLAELEYSPITVKAMENQVKTLVVVKLKTGRFHQIRAQFSHRGTTIVGDGKYGNRDKSARMPALFAYSLSFSCENKTYNISALPILDSYPWSIFDRSCYDFTEK